MQLLTIILPVYNVDGYLSENLESINRQTYNHIQLIIIDDGSTDNSSEIIETFKKNNNLKEVIAVRQKNAGLSEARNSALPYVKGDLIWFIDSDDVIERIDAVSIIVKRFDEEPSLSMLFFGVDLLINDVGENWGTRPSDSWNYMDTERVMTKKDFLKEVTPRISVWPYVFKANIIKDNEISFIPHILYEDVTFTLQILHYSQKIQFLNKKLYLYRQRKASIMDSQNVSTLDIVSWEKIVEFLFSFMKQKDITANHDDFRLFKHHVSYIIGNIFLNKVGSFKDRYNLFKDAQMIGVTSNKLVVKLLLGQLRKEKNAPI